MAFTCFMFFCNVLIPLIMVVGGYWMHTYPPTKINSVFGYRTRMSKKNPDTWAFAHDCCGRLWIRAGLLLAVPSILVQLPFMQAGEDTIGTLTLVIEMLQLMVLLFTVFLVEKKMKKTFDENGMRR